MSLPTLYEHYTGGGITSGLTTDNKYFKLNDRNITIYSGAMHYFRVPQAYWRDRLRKMRAAGLNAVETYVPWNLHEPEPGHYDFGKGGSDFEELLDIEEFFTIAKAEDLFVIVRPGPYICSEWEFGGLPSWLLREKDIQVRTSDVVFMGFVEKYFKALLAILSLLQFTLGGPIIAFQIENEYGSLKINDSNYLNGIKDIFIKNCVKELMFTSDGASIGNYGQIPGVLYTANFNSDPENQLKIMQTYQPGKPSMVMEFWSGWFDHWSEKHNTVGNIHYLKYLERILKYPASVNIYMFHGGTSFGFMNGANMGGSSTNNQDFQPDTNSYDYDAPLTENGDYTSKYYSTKNLLANYNTIPTRLPIQPNITKRIAYKAIDIVQYIEFDDMLLQAPHRIKSKILLPMELLPINNNSGQSYGYIVYRKTNLDIIKNSILEIEGHVCDTIMVLINGDLISKVLATKEDLNGFGYWRLKDSAINLGNTLYMNATLDLVVENWGRNNFGNLHQFRQFKGIWQGNVSINDVKLFDWEIIPLEFKRNWTSNLDLWRTTNNINVIEGPALYRAYLLLDHKPVTDTYVYMRNWHKGIIIVNFFVLSRYANIGPQQTAYLPAPFLTQGVNEIYIFDHFKSEKKIFFSDKPIYSNV